METGFSKKMRSVNNHNSAARDHYHTSVFGVLQHITVDSNTDGSFTTAISNTFRTHS